MEKFSTLIINMMKDYELFASQGGPIIIAQVLFYSSLANFLFFFLNKEQRKIILIMFFLYI